MLNITDVKNFIRATDDDDELVQNLMLAADSYLDGAISNYNEIYSNSSPKWQAKADLAKKLLIADWYENRTPTEVPTNSAIKLIITQLELEQ